MTIVLRRSLIFRQEDNPGIDDLYQSLSQAVKLEIANWPGLRDRPDIRDSWLNADYSIGHESEFVTCRELKAEPDIARLLNIKLVYQDRDYRWARNLQVGRLREDEVSLWDEWDFEWKSPAFRRGTAYETVIDLCSFTYAYSYKNIDGLWAGKPYTVGSGRVEAFTDFIKSPERCLPIVVISQANDEHGHWPINAVAAARKVQGLAHLIKLEDDKSAQRLRGFLREHGCYNGAVRIYWPGYKVTDSRDSHPFWPPSRMRTAGYEASITNEVFARIADRSPFCSVGVINEIDRLEKQLSDYERDKQQKQAKTEWEDWRLEYEKVEKERDSLRDETTRIKIENSRLEHENRNLRWQINNAWQRVRQVKPEDEQSVTSLIFLSGKAYEQYRSFTTDEKRYWDENILGKMLDEQLRERQSEPVHGPNGTCWVYPRSGTASGRRLIYYNEGNNIFICELFREHDSRYDELRTQGVDREAYNEFETLWCDTMTDS